MNSLVAHYDRSIADRTNGKESPIQGAAAPPQERISALRGASVTVDPRKAARVALALVMMTLAVLSASLYVAAIHHNQQISNLRSRGVAVQVTVTGCLGLLGGSGSNAAGYLCTGTFTLGGARHSDTIPDSLLHKPGAKLSEVTDPDDPGLLATPAQVRSERTSWTVYVVPSAVLAVLIVLMVVVVVVRRPHASAEPGQDGGV